MELMTFNTPPHPCKFSPLETEEHSCAQKGLPHVLNITNYPSNLEHSFTYCLANFFFCLIYVVEYSNSSLFMCSMPLYKYSEIYPSILLLMNM